MKMKLKGKHSIILLLVFIVTVVALFTISMVPAVFPTQVLKADEAEDDIAMDLCIITNTYIDTGRVDWYGYYRCMGVYKGWI